MPEEAKCKNHPLKQAVTRCKRCNKPLCADCIMQTEIGVFCSDECYQATTEFMQKVSGEAPKRKVSLFQKKGFKQLIILVILLVVLYFLLASVTGHRNIGDIIEVVRGWIGI